MEGNISRLINSKGFGFIAGTDGNEYFFHMSSIKGARFDSLREGQFVIFEGRNTPKGYRAENVRVG